MLRSEKRAFWRGHVSRWSVSGQSQAAYCRESGLSLSCFKYWRRVLRVSGSPAESSPAFASVLVESEGDDSVSASLTSQDSGLSLSLWGQHELRLSVGFCEESFQRVLRAVSEL